MVIDFLVPLGKARGYFLRKSPGQYQNCFLPYSFDLRPPFTFTCQHCDIITPDDKVSESLRSPIHSLYPLQCCPHVCLNLADPKTSFLLTSLFKFLTHWAAGFSLGTKSNYHEQTYLHICVQQPQQKWFPFTPEASHNFPPDRWHPLRLLPHSQKLDLVALYSLWVYLFTDLYPTCAPCWVSLEWISVFSHKARLRTGSEAAGKQRGL